VSVGARIRKRLRVLRRPGVILTLVVLFLALVVWFIGPLIAFGDMRPLGSSSARLAMLLLLALVWGGVGFLMRTKRSSEEAALLAALRKQEEEATAKSDRATAEAEAEISAFRDAAGRAMGLLRRGHGDLFVSARYALPWYMVLGADGAGKTSLVRASGLTLPFEGDGAVETPSARFHISDQALLVEFSGRLTGSEEPQARQLWLKALQHIRSLRSRQPVNGILVAVSVDELLAMLPEEAVAYATAIRQRLDEAVQRLRANAPVYIVVTKLDRIVGFEELFEDLTTEERAAAFGLPIAPDLGGDARGPAEALNKGFAGLVERIMQRQFVCLQEEPDEMRRRRAFEFPAQFALLRERIQPFVQQLATQHRFGTATNMRGVFFVSCRQDGDNVDALAGSLAPVFGRSAAALSLAPDPVMRRVRPFFLYGLFRKAILPEADLGGLTRPALAAARFKDLAINAVLCLAAFAALAFWWFGFSDGRAYVAGVTGQTTAARGEIAEAVPGGTLSMRFEPVLAVLDRLAALSEAEPRGATFGLYSPDPVQGEARKAYDKALANLFFPFVWQYLRQGLENPATPAALRFTQLKFYLMLTGERPPGRETAALLGPDFAANWMLYDRSDAVDRRIAEHFSELASVAIPAPAADVALIEKARADITNYSLARLAYDQALTLPDVAAMAMWRPVDHMGLSGPEALARVSGASFFDGIEGIYTKNGLGVMMRASAEAASTLADDLWVMGRPDTALDRERETGRIRDGLADLYRVTYMSRWDSLIADLGISGETDARRLADAVAIVAGNPSPAKELFVAIAAEVDLQDLSTTAASAVEALAAERLSQVTKTVRAPRRVVNVPQSVSDHFRAFRLAVVPAAEGQQSQVDDMLAALEPLYRQLNHVAAGGDVLELGAEPQTILSQLTDRNGKLPANLQPFFARILTQVGAVTGGSSRERLKEIWTSTILPLCTATTVGRYPFDRESINDASLDDFSRLLGPQGAIAGFRDTYLKPYIDRTTKPWRWKSGQQFGLGFPDEVLAAFEKADDITTVFFAGQEKPNVDFTVEVGKLDMTARAFLIDIGGKVASYTHGPPAGTQYLWPPENLVAGASMSMTPEVAGQRNILTEQGAWALFRLFDQGRKIEKNPTDVVTYQFRLGSRAVLMRLTAPATRNPFARDVLSPFACPTL
jgi:type VI secretion system protein ImpL